VHPTAAAVSPVGTEDGIVVVLVVIGVVVVVLAIVVVVLVTVVVLVVVVVVLVIVVVLAVVVLVLVSVVVLAVVVLVLVSVVVLTDLHTFAVHTPLQQLRFVPQDAPSGLHETARASRGSDTRSVPAMARMRRGSDVIRPAIGSTGRRRHHTSHVRIPGGIGKLSRPGAGVRATPAPDAWPLSSRDAEEAEERYRCC
jgi:hypothetical protein